MDDYFKEAVRILKNQPSDLGLSEANELSYQLLSSPNQEMLIDLVSARSIEDRILIFACLVGLYNSNRGVEDVEFSVSHCLQIIRQRDLEIGKIEQYTFEDANKIMLGLMDLLNSVKLDEDLSLADVNLNNAIIDATKSSPELFSTRSLYIITIYILNNLSVPDENLMSLAVILRDMVLKGRRML